MIRQCAVMVGGLGSRLGALTAETPKPLLPVGGRPFLAWLLRELVRFGIDDVLLLTGFRADKIDAALAGIKAQLPQDVRITLSEEATPAGTGGCVWNARHLLQPHFMVCNGDSLLAANLAPLVGWRDAPAGDNVGHLMLRHVPDAARYGTVALDGDRVVSFREKQGHSPGWINAGLYAFNRSILDYLTPDCSLERDALAPLAAEGRLTATRGEGYFVDIGIPDDLARADAELARHVLRPALFLDRALLIDDHSLERGQDGWAWRDGARDAIRVASDRGWHVFVIADQPAPGTAQPTGAEIRHQFRQMADQARVAGGTVDDLCLFSREAPSGGLLDVIERWEIDPKRAVLIGDQSINVPASGLAFHPWRSGDLASFVGTAMDTLDREVMRPPA